jgi:hypothetical protein
MSSHDHSAQDYLNLPGDQDNFVPMQIPNNNDDNVNYHPTTFVFYLPLPNDTIYRVTYTQLHSFEIATLLNNGDSHFPHHQNIQGLIRQQIYQRVQQQPQQQSQTYDIIPNSQVDMIPSNSQVNSNNNISNYMIPSNEAISENTDTTNYTNP